MEFEVVHDALAQVGIPLKADIEQAWRDFAGWRVNYDAVLVGLAVLTMAPPAPWSSDRTPERSWSLSGATRAAQQAAADIAAGRRLV